MVNCAQGLQLALDNAEQLLLLSIYGLSQRIIILLLAVPRFLRLLLLVTLLLLFLDSLLVVTVVPLAVE